VNEELEYSLKSNDFRWITPKILFVIVVAVVVGWSSIINVNTIKAIALVNTDIVLSPLYTADDKTTSQKAIFVNGITPAKAVIFSGHGMAKDVNFTDRGEALIIQRGSNGVIENKGQGAMITTSGGKASFAFHDIGHSDSNGTITATGAAFFDANATGKLAFLGNVVAVYKDQIYKDGTDKVIAWMWK
jgi:hypothetical protein